MLNQITVMGRLTRDPELRRTGSGISVASFTVACDRDRAMKDQEKETDFFDCVAWRGTGEFIAKYFRKGSMIIVSGRMENRRWNDKDGNKRVSNEINVDVAYFGDSAKKDGGAPSNTESPAGYPQGNNAAYPPYPAYPGNSNTPGEQSGQAGSYGAPGAWSQNQAPVPQPQYGSQSQTTVPAPQAPPSNWTQPSSGHTQCSAMDEEALDQF